MNSLNSIKHFQIGDHQVSEMGYVYNGVNEVIVGNDNSPLFNVKGIRKNGLLGKKSVDAIQKFLNRIYRMTDAIQKFLNRIYRMTDAIQKFLNSIYRMTDAIQKFLNSIYRMTDAIQKFLNGIKFLEGSYNTFSYMINKINSTII